jgi:N-acetylglucosamine-6-sulfatase
MNGTLLAAAALAIALVPVPARSAPAGAVRPNIILVLVDDLRWDDLACAGHPFVLSPQIDRVAHEGARFLNAFVTTPLCSPSRASLLSGQYAHSHGIVDNTDRSAASHRLATFPRLLQEAGYETGYIGKWHMGNDASPRPGFDYWLGMAGQGSSNDPALNENGRPLVLRGYTTDIFNERAVAFVKRARKRPFLLYLSHKALHPEGEQRADGSLSDPGASNFIPAQRHRSLYAGLQVPRRPNALVAPQGKPALQRPLGSLPPLGPATGSSDQTILDRLRMLAAVDEGLGQIFAALEETRQLENSLIVVAGDNGYFYGEHGLSVERRLAYEESLRIPLLMRLPRVVRPGSTPAAMVLTIDIAPTLLELAGVGVPSAMQGRSLLPLLRGEPAAWRTSFLVEYWSDKVFPRIANMAYRAIRTERWKWIRYLELPGMDELYDLQADPYEMANVIDAPRTQAVRDELSAELGRLLRETAAPGNP